MPSLLVHTLGCKLNQLESEAYINEYLEAGYELGGDNPSVIIINTCTVTSKADQKARRLIRKMLRDYPNAAVIVAGCYAQLEKIPSRTDAEAQRTQRLIFKEKENRFEFNPKVFSLHTRSFLKIQDGCDNHCTYCRIRLARGKSVSLPAEKVLERIKILEADYAETVLTGVNISQYLSVPSVSPCSSCVNLLDLLEYLLSNTEKIAIRLSSLDPQFVNEDFAKVLAHKRVRPHFHLSIQSCSEKILKRMGRTYNAQTIENAVKFLRAAKDDPFLACDIIAGFPGEAEEDFNETYELCKKLDFAWIHVFPYSKRPGTPACDYTEKVQDTEVTRRVQLLTDLARQGRQKYEKRWLGREAEVLVEKGGRGITENYLKVRLDKSKKLTAGTVFKCLLKPEMFDII